jgi:hypothetical protein
MTENPRTTSARDHDDSDLIDGMAPAGQAQTGTEKGGRLGRQVGSDADLTRAIEDPDAQRRATKADDQDAGVAYDGDRRGNDG